jgi:hypothetical protein
MNNQAAIQQFAKKEQQLLAAYRRAQALEEKYRTLLTGPNGVFAWPFNWDYNLIYDLQYRLEARIKDLQSDYYDWHFLTFGFNVY